jgi:hypothetical protein
MLTVSVAQGKGLAPTARPTAKRNHEPIAPPSATSSDAVRKEGGFIACALASETGTGK